MDRGRIFKSLLLIKSEIYRQRKSAGCGGSPLDGSSGSGAREMRCASKTNRGLHRDAAADETETLTRKNLVGGSDKGFWQ